MDRALILAIEGSRGKAVASVIFGQPSGELEVRADRPVMRALSIQMGGRFIMGQGAVPILRNGQVIGAGGSRWFSGRKAGIEPGDTIVVPLDTDRVPALIQWAAITQVLFNLGLAAAAVSSF